MLGMRGVGSGCAPDARRWQSDMSGNVLEVSDLRVEFRLHGQGALRAVDGVSFRVPHGKTVALVGNQGPESR